MTPTAFGLAMIRACLARPYELYNERPDVELIESCWYEDHLIPLLEKLGIKRVPVNTPKEPFEKSFEAIFPADAIDSVAIDAMFENADRRVSVGGNVYILKVSYKRSTWRRIRISASNTLQHLHEAIQDAFEFYDDHLYAFFMDGQPWSSDAYWSRGDDQQPYADKAVIGRLGLVPGKDFCTFSTLAMSGSLMCELRKHLTLMCRQQDRCLLGVKGKLPNSIRIMRTILSGNSIKSA